MRRKVRSREQRREFWEWKARAIGRAPPIDLEFFDFLSISTAPLLFSLFLSLSTFQDEVGIRHGRYANKIADHVADIHGETSSRQEQEEKVAEETSSSSSSSEQRLRAAAADRRVTLCVEGNISAGKSSFLRFIADECVELQDVIEVVPEPVDKWQAVGPDRVNVLEQVRERKKKKRGRERGWTERKVKLKRKREKTAREDKFFNAR